jgi:large subunit ribosomal protein L21
LEFGVVEGQHLLVEKLAVEEGAKVSLEPLLYRGDREILDGADLAKVSVEAKVVAHERGPKLRVVKFKPKRGYKRHNGFRSSLTQIEIESIGAGRAKKAAAVKPKAEPAAEAPAAAPARTAHPPKDYDELTVAQISEQASGWRRPNIEAALEHERANANRKGAIAALESALKEKESH